VIYLLRMALRNTLRNRRRTLLTLVAIFLGIGIFVMAQSLITGIERTMIGTEVDSEQSHLRVMTRAFTDEAEFFPIEKDLEAVDAIAAKVATLPGAVMARRTSFMLQISDRKRSLNARGLAIDPASYEKVIRLGNGLAQPPPGAPAWVWIGTDIANAFGGLKAGDRVSLQAKTQHGTRNALTDVVVAGVVSTGHPLVDNFTAFIPMSVATELLDIPEGYATELLARFPDPDEALAAEKLVESPSINAETWYEKTEYIRTFNQIRRTIFNIFTVVIMLMAAAGVANTTLMSGFERISEIGALLALGLSRARVLLLFLIEALLVAVAGVTAGLIAGGIPASYLERHGIPFPGIQEEVGASVPAPPVLYLDLTPRTLVLGAILGLAVTLVAALYPAWKLSRTDPIHALKVEG
jgi:putative ABC transport system permease protein